MASPAGTGADGAPATGFPGERGAALVAALERRFGAVVTRARIGAQALELLRPPSAEALISESEFARDERLPYWAELWPAAVALAGAVAAERGGGRRLLELGCGLGLVVVAALRAGYEVTATDYYEDALAFTRVNAWRVAGREPHTRAADWRALPADLGTYDRVVAADVLYERPYAALMADALDRTLAAQGLATVADPGRIALSAFLDESRARGLEAVRAEERIVPDEQGGTRHAIRLFTFRRR